MNQQHSSQTLVIGYSSHGFVATDILMAMGVTITSYCDDEEKAYNPFNLTYLGKEGHFFSSHSYLNNKQNWQAFIGIGNNNIREKVYTFLMSKNASIINAIHPKTILAPSVQFGKGVMVCANATINPLTKIGNGVVCNTSCSIDHECILDDFSHIAPGAVLCGLVKIGKRSFIGANAVIRQGITIGDDVTIGIGACVVKDILEPGKYVGIPAKKLL